MRCLLHDESCAPLASKNMFVMEAAIETFQLSGWSKAFAPMKVWAMVVTFDVSQSSGWSNARA